MYMQEDTISINHNWLNAANIDICWDFVKTSLASVQQEISEHKDMMHNWSEHCQVGALFSLLYFCRFIPVCISVAIIAISLLLLLIMT